MYIELIESTLNEVRSSDISYKEVQAKGEITKVIAELDKQKASAASKLAMQYDKLNKALQEAQEQRDIANKDLKEYVDELFDANDALVTRAIETASVTISVAKATQQSMTDYAKVLEELVKMVPDLTKKVDELKNQYTRIIEKSPALRVKVEEGTLKNTVINALISFADKIFGWLDWYDNKLNKIKSMIH